MALPLILNTGVTLNGVFFGWSLAVTVSSSDLLALRATTKTLVAAPGAGLIHTFLAAELLLDATATAYVVGSNDLGVKYENGSGVQVSNTIETTGFLDQTADTATSCTAKTDAIVAKTGAENKALVLHNIGGSEFTT